MKISCQMTEDLLPLVGEGIASPDSQTAVTEHVAACPSCHKRYQAQLQPFSLPTNETPPLPLKAVSRQLRQQKTGLAGLVISLVGLIAVLIFAWLSYPQYLPYSPDLIQLSQTSDGYTYAELPRAATSVSSYQVNESGQEVIYLEAWTSTWDRLLQPNASPKRLLLASPEEVNRQFRYSDFTATEGSNLIGLSVAGNQPIEGIRLLPRLALNFYFLVAGLAGLLGLIVWLIFRKRHWAWVARSLFFLGLSYLIAHGLIKGFTGSSYHMVRDFSLICLTGLLLFGCFSFGYRLWHDRRTSRLASC